MDGPSFKINGKPLTFYLDTKTKTWTIGINYKDPILTVSKGKGYAIIEFLKALVEVIDTDLELKKDPHSA